MIGSRWVFVAALAAAVSLASAVPAVARPVAGTPPVPSYVALGDSYTAGPLIPPQTGMPPGCARSNRNYPALVAATVGAVEFRDASCSGATTRDLTAPQTTRAGVNPPQLDALTPDTRLVTLGIGGNDLGFGEIVQECAARSPREPAGAACRDFYTAGGTDRLAARIADTAPAVAAALAGIARRSPTARVLLVGYPALLPDAGPGCFPAVPFSPGDVAYLRETQLRLDAMLVRQARAAGVDHVDTYRPSIGHDMCQLPGVKWVEGLVPTSPAAPVHPNALGMTATAQAVVRTLDAR